MPEFECSRPQLEGPEFECSGPQLEGPEFECSGPQLEGPEFEYSELSVKICGSRYCELDFVCLRIGHQSKSQVVTFQLRSGAPELRVQRLGSRTAVLLYTTVQAYREHNSSYAWTLTLREEQRLRVFENKVLRKIFEAKRDEVTGEWRKLHNAELHALYSSRDIIRNIKSRRLRWAGHVARMGESRNVYSVLVGRPAGKRPLGRPRRRWEDNIKMDLREMGYDDRDWINLVQDRDQWRAYVRAAMNLRVP
ncbi:hypothetical protein ANN_01862 [Periplaneta americana]|uniref:Uncharacterized protein n=1 Tax=Periplaneta americana TaxID=6978 RepID=A0ABQ8TX52_PERAM|nr:hypothetical protein ANN_01862 [Periplaneta americana]